VLGRIVEEGERWYDIFLYSARAIVTQLPKTGTPIRCD
jgi:hypothetical protein